MQNKIFFPAIALLNRMGYTRKFTLLWLMSLVAIAVVVYSLFTSLERVIQPSQRELQGLALIGPISRTIQFTQLHRGFSALLLGGNGTMKDRRAAKESEVDAAFETMEGKLPPGLTSSEDFRHIKAEWERLRKEGLHWTMSENFAAHTSLIEQLQLFELSVADNYALILDPELATFYLIDTTANKLPHALEHLGQLRAYGTGILARKRITEPQKAKLNALTAGLDSTLRELRINLEKTGRYNPAVQQSLMAAYGGIAGSARQITGLVASDILTSHFVTPPDAFLDMTTVAIDQGYTQMYQALLPTAKTLIEARIAQAENTLLTSVGSALLLFLLVVYISVGIYYAITGSIQSLVRSAHTFAEGDLHVRVKLGTRDELSQIGDSFNKMADGFSALLEARKRAEAEIAAINRELGQANAKIEEERAQLADRVAERTAQLLYANRAKDSFLATMSHEIRTPLGGLLGMMELISLSRLDGKQRETLQAARDSGRSLLRIVNDILDWSKIEAGKLELSPQAATIPEIIKSVMCTYLPLASAKGLLLRQQVDSKLGAAHIFDPLRLSQILNNFTSNAIKFTGQGAVKISAKLIARHEGAEQVRFCVKDSGTGINMEQQARLFQHYEQASADTARMYGGTGLGLAICHSLAELMEGAISVESIPGRGSTFCITVSLPVADPAAQRDVQLRQARENSSDNTPDIAPLVKDGRRVSVLVVDDHPVNRMLLKQQLELLGMHAEDAAYGIVALSLWRAGRFDLIITDCHMPEMDGYELTRSIRGMEQHDGRQRVPIIAWTANVLDEEEGRCRTAGMDDMLTKPTELADLRAMLLKWLAKADQPAAETPPAKASRPVGFVDAAPAAAPIDFSVLKKIATSHAAQVEMLQEFNLHNRSDIADLKEALKDGNQAAVARSAHRIKGASRMVGAQGLEGICATIERAAAQCDLNGARVVADTVLDETIERIEAAISAFIAAQ